MHKLGHSKSLRELKVSIFKQALFEDLNPCSLRDIGQKAQVVQTGLVSVAL